MSAQVKPEISVIIVNWNVRDYLAKCLQSIQQFPPEVPYEVWVVDNASTDNSSAMVTTDFPWVKLIQSNRNLGFSGGNNLALAKTSGKYLLLLNPDTEVFPETFSTICQFLDEHPKAGALGVKIVGEDGKNQPSNKAFPRLRTLLWTALFLDVLFSKSRIFGEYTMSYWNHEDERQVDQPSGCALAVRQEILKTVGPMDDRFFLYFDEVDWCYRIKKAGYEIWYTPKTKVLHYGGKSSAQIRGASNHASHQSLYRYFIKHTPLPPFLTVLLVQSIQLLPVLFVLFLMGAVVWIGWTLKSILSS